MEKKKDHIWKFVYYLVTFVKFITENMRRNPQGLDTINSNE